MADEALLPDAPAAFESQDSWLALTDAGLGRLDLRRLVREPELIALDTAIWSHEIKHRLLTAHYDAQRAIYTGARARYNKASALQPDLLWDALLEMRDILSAAATTYDKLVESRESVNEQIEAWMDRQGFGGVVGPDGVERVNLEGRNSTGQLSSRRLRIPHEAQCALDGQAILQHALEDVRQRVHTATNSGVGHRASDRSEIAGPQSDRVSLPVQDLIRTPGAELGQ